METGAITQYIDVAQLVLYVFWAFFAGLIFYLVRENHREGYPMDTGREDGPVVTGWPIPDPKTYKLSNGHEVQAPDFNRPDGQYKSQNTQLWGGAPIEPVGDPLLAGVGPGAWSQRADHPDRDLHGNPLIVPLRTVSDHGVAHQDTDPRGLPVYGADGEVAGTVSDLWIDTAEMMFRYVEIDLPNGGRRVLMPINFARIKAHGLFVYALMAHQFANVPATKSAQEITLLEEEKIMGYFGAGLLYAEPSRLEPPL